MRAELRLLHVEDSEPDAALVARALRSGGVDCHILRVQTLAEYTTALQQPWDVILCDQTLPDFDASSALVMANTEAENVPFIVVSGTIDEATASGILAAGAMDCVMKSNLRRLVPAVALALALARAEEERHRQDTEARLRLLSRAVEQSGSLVIITDAGGWIEYVNTQFCRVSGYAPDEILGLRPRQVRGDTPPEVFAELWSTITAGRVWRGELSNRTSSGEVYRVAATISPVTAADGGITHFVGIQEDITKDWRRDTLETALDTARACPVLS